MEQSIEGNTRKTGSGVACTPRGRFWGHGVKGSMRELLMDAHISIRCMEEPSRHRYEPRCRVAELK